MSSLHASELRDILLRQIQMASQGSAAAWPFAEASIRDTLDKLLAREGVQQVSSAMAVPVFKTVPTPKGKGDFPGRLVRITQPLDGPHGRVPTGTLATVIEVRRRGINLTTETCRCCAVRVNLESVQLYQFEFVMPG